VARTARELDDATRALRFCEAAVSLALGVVLLDRVTGGVIARTWRRVTAPPARAVVEHLEPLGVAAEAERITRAAANAAREAG
jgi:hypothetical protein